MKTFINYIKSEGVEDSSLDEEFSPEIAKMAHDDGHVKGVSLADGATLKRATAINHWHNQHGGMYKNTLLKVSKQVERIKSTTLINITISI